MFERGVFGQEFPDGVWSFLPDSMYLLGYLFIYARRVIWLELHEVCTFL